MNYFLISVTLTDGTVHTGVRTLEYGDIDHAWVLYKSKSEEKWGIRIIDYSCVQLSTHCEHVKKLLAPRGSIGRAVGGRGGKKGQIT